MQTKKIHFVVTPLNYAYYRNRTYDVKADLAEKLVSQGYAVYPDPKLPADFPGRDALIDAGIATVEQVRRFSDLTAIKGIGKASATKIQDYLAK